MPPRRHRGLHVAVPVARIGGYHRSVQEQRQRHPPNFQCVRVGTRGPDASSARAGEVLPRVHLILSPLPSFPGESLAVLPEVLLNDGVELDDIQPQQPADCPGPDSSHISYRCVTSSFGHRISLRNLPVRPPPQSGHLDMFPSIHHSKAVVRSSPPLPPTWGRGYGP
jgi:hypothetical protein